MRSVGITGATGFLGTALRKAFESDGWSVVELGRKPSRQGVAFIEFDLSSNVDLKLPQLDLLIHCAHQFGLPSFEAELAVNVAAARRLLVATANRSIPFVYISSMAAFAGARSLYGRSKLEIEKHVFESSGLVIRPGLIVGNGSSGLVPAMSRFISRSRIVPLIGAGKQVLYLCEVEKFAFYALKACKEFVSSKPSSKPIVIAEAQPITFRELLERLASEKQRHVFFVPIPVPFIYILLKLAEALKIPIPFRSDSLLGLVHSNPNPFLAVEQLELDSRTHS